MTVKSSRRATLERTLLRSDFCLTKISHTLRHSSFFEKRRAWFDYSLASALTTAHCRYHLFTRAPSVQALTVKSSRRARMQINRIIMRFVFLYMQIIKRF